LVATAFSQSDPPAVATDLSAAELEAFLRQIVPPAVSCGLTVFARSEDTGELAASLLTHDFADPPAFRHDQIAPKFLPLFAMLNVLDEQFTTGKTISTGEYLHLFMLATKAEFAGQGVGQALIAFCVENGLHHGYRAAVTEATGRISQHLFRKN